ncbi:MAG: phosphodiesterase [Rhodospirillaceae bacterium]|nr:phosphodiesterase [Rhodospirillaceae bacterium]
MLFAQISDLHILPPGERLTGRVDTAAHLQAAVERLNALEPRPAFVIATGDLVDQGAADEYAHLRAIIAPLGIPVHLMVGNHDAREALRAAFPDHTYLGTGPFVQYVIESGPLRLIALDTLDPGRPGGLLCAERLAWLAERLDEAPDRPTVIAMHHPPFETGIGHMDKMGCANADRLAAIIGRHSQVEHILCGHLHRPIMTRFSGTIASTMPSTAHQVALDLVGGPARFVMEPPAVRLCQWSSDAGLVSHFDYVGDYGPRYPFH